MDKRTCTTDGCNRPHYARGLCARHYDSLRRQHKMAGVPLPSPSSRKRPGRTCTVEDCDKIAIARGWCDAHYRRWKITGDPLTPRKITSHPPGSVCLADGCEKRPHSRGYCAAHYARWRAHGDPLNAKHSAPYPADAVCMVEDCGRRPRIRGYCSRHHRNLTEYGNPVPRKERSLGERLAEIGWDVTATGCWEWCGSRNGLGYGEFNAKLLGYVNARAHRVVYEHYAGPIPTGLELRHKCDNPPCVNPEHLEPGTHAQNMQDMAERGRARRDRCRNGHDRTAPGATRVIERTRDGKTETETICIECSRDRARAATRRFRQRKREALIVA